MTEKDFHPVANIFPLMTGEAFQALVDDINLNGLRESIWTHEEKIVDGRNRFNACMKAGVSPTYRDWDGKGSLIEFVVSLNLHRRHLSESQRAMVGAKLANISHGGNRRSEFQDSNMNLEPVTNDDAAEMLNVSRHSVSTARVIRKEGIPEVVAAVESGELSLRAADEIVRQPKEGQDEALRAKREGRAHSNGNGKIATHTRRLNGRKAPEAIRSAIGTLVGMASSFDSFSAKDAAPTPEEAAEWEKDLALVISALNRFRKQLKGEGATHV